MNEFKPDREWVILQKELSDKIPDNEIAWRIYTRYRDSYILEVLDSMHRKLEFLEKEAEHAREVARIEGETNKGSY
jgi:hypothetical protein